MSLIDEGHAKQRSNAIGSCKCGNRRQKHATYKCHSFMVCQSTICPIPDGNEANMGDISIYM
eukprot:scaffold45844_cov49-Attheya_sp.AAC.4